MKIPHHNYDITTQDSLYQSLDLEFSPQQISEAEWQVIYQYIESLKETAIPDEMAQIFTALRVWAPERFRMDLFDDQVQRRLGNSLSPEDNYPLPAEFYTVTLVFSPVTAAFKLILGTNQVKISVGGVPAQMEGGINEVLNIHKWSSDNVIGDRVLIPAMHLKILFPERDIEAKLTEDPTEWARMMGYISNTRKNQSTSSFFYVAAALRIVAPSQFRLLNISETEISNMYAELGDLLTYAPGLFLKAVLNYTIVTAKDLSVTDSGINLVTSAQDNDIPLLSPFPVMDW